MAEPRTCPLPSMTALFCTGVDCPGQAEELQRHGADIVVSNITELGGRR